MSVLFLTFGLLAIVMIGMAIGVIMGREPLKGSCGGLNKVGMTGACDICGGSGSKTAQAAKAQADANTDLFYDASVDERRND